MADLDVTQLELITPHVTTQLQAFNSQVVAHLKNYKPEISRIYDRLGELAATNERLEGHLKALESDVNRNHDQSTSSDNLLAERLSKVEQLLSALPSWKEDLVGRIEALTRETRAKHDAASSRTTVLEDSMNAHVQATRERLDMLTSVARTASEARAQQQERIDEMDTDLRRLREATERDINENKLRLRRHDEQLVMANSKLSEHGGLLSGHKIELARLKDSSDQHNRQLENIARGMDKLHDISAGLGQEVNLMKRGMATTDVNLSTLEAKVLSADAEAQTRFRTLEEHRNMLFQFKDETHAAIERIDRSHELMTDRVQMLDAKVEAGPPGLWKMASQVAAHEDELAMCRTGLAAAKSTNDELTRRLDDVLSAMSHQRDVATQLREECRMLGDRLTAEAARGQQYVDDQLQPLARRYELEAMRKNMEAGLERLESALAGSGERLKFELLHDESAQVDSIRSYMSEVERRNADLAERISQLESGLAGEAERGRSVAAVTRELRGALDGLLCTSQADLARLRATMTSLHEEYEEMSKKARRAGLLTVTQVEDLIDMRLNSPVLDSVIARKIAQMNLMNGGAPFSPVGRSAPSATAMFSYGRFTSGAVRPGAAGPSWQPSSVQRQLSASTASALMTPVGGGPSAAGGGGTGTSTPGGAFIVTSPTSLSGEAAGGAGGAGPPGGVITILDEAVGGGDGSGGGGGGAVASDPALGLRLVQVESDMARLFEAFRSLGSRVAPVSEVADLRQELADLTATVQHVKVSQGVLGEAGEEAVRRHIHATLVPEMLRRQSLEARRIMGWMDEQLIEVSRELAAVRRAQARLETRVDGAVATVTAAAEGGGGGGGGASVDGAGRSQRSLASRPVSASVALTSSLSLPYADADVVALGDRLTEVAEQLSFLSEVLGVPLRRRKGRAAAAAAAERELSRIDSGGLSGSGSGGDGGRRASEEVKESVAHIAARASVAGTVSEPSVGADQPTMERTSSTVGEAAAAPPPPDGGDAADGGGDGDSGLRLSTSSPDPSGRGALGYSSMSVGQAQGAAAGGAGGGAAVSTFTAAATATAAAAESAAAVAEAVAAAGPAPTVDGLTLSLPSLLQRIQQLETAVHTISTGQQALTAAAALHAVAPAAADTGARPRRGAAAAAALPPPAPTVAAAAAIQGMVDSAVAELRLRIKLMEQEVPLMARSFEVKALKRIVQDAHMKANVALTHGSSFGGGGPAGLGPGSHLPPPGGRVRANGAGRSGALSAGAGGSVVVLDPQLSKRLSALELAVATIDERGRAIEDRWAPPTESGGGRPPGSVGASSSGLAGSSFGHGHGHGYSHGEVSRLQSTVAQLAREVQRLAAAQAGAGSGGKGGGGGGGGGNRDDDGGGGGLYGQADGMRGGGGGGGGPYGGMPAAGYAPYGMAEVVNVELSGIAHDLALAAHEEMQRIRDGPLPDGTQDGLPTPAAIANREAALARLRRKPLEVSAHVELLESVKLHLDRLMRRSTSCTTDRLVLLAAMNAMRIKLLENEAEAFREQIIAVFRSLERAFSALVKLQEAVSSKGSAAAVSSLANLLQDISAGLATLAAHAAMRDSAPLSARGQAAAAAAVAAASVAVEQTRRRQGSGNSADGPPASPALPPSPATAASGGGSGGPLDEALHLLAARGPSPTGIMRPASPVRLSGPGVHTAMNRHHAAAARGAAHGGGGGARHGAVSAAAGPHQSWPGSRAVSSPVGHPAANAVKAGGSGSGLPVPPAAMAAAAAAGGPPPSRGGGGSGAGGSSGSLGGGISPDMPPLAGAGAMDPAGGGASGPNRMWSGRRPASAIANGLHVGVGAVLPPGSPGPLPSPGAAVGVRHPGSPGAMGDPRVSGPGLPSIGASGLGPGRAAAGRG